jgi:hypothetical protein
MITKQTNATLSSETKLILGAITIKLLLFISDKFLVLEVLRTIKETKTTPYTD